MGQTRFDREMRDAARPRAVMELEAAGISRATLRGNTWRQTCRGYYVPSHLERTPTQRILDYLPLVPDTGAFGGWASAYALGVEQLDGYDSRALSPQPVPVLLGADVGRRRRGEVSYSRDRLAHSETVVRHGLRIADARRTTFDGARYAVDLGEAVAFVDAVANAGVCSVGDFGRALPQRGGWAGIVQARAAYALADGAARSLWESRLRVMYVVEAELPRPLVNVPVFDLSGRLVAIPDLLDAEAGFVAEFDGQHHRQRAQHRADNVREVALERLGLTVVRVDSLDLLRHRRHTVARLRDGHARGCLRDRRLDRWSLQGDLAR